MDLLSCPYSHFAPPTIQYCEANLCSYIAQPANAYSNFIYIIISLYLLSHILSHIRKYKNNPLWMLPVAAILIGIFSFTYHATYTFFGQLLDLGSMFLLSSLLIILNISRFDFAAKKMRLLVISYICLVLICTYVVYTIRTIGGFNIGIPIFALQILIALIMEYLLYKRRTLRYRLKYLLAASALLFIALIFWFLDYKHMWCDEQTYHLINGHAVWHVINSFCFIFLYLFYRQFFLPHTEP